MIVEAFADKAGDASTRAADLATRRADHVRNILVAAGLPADRITAASGDPRDKRGPGAPQVVMTVQSQTARNAEPGGASP